MIIAGADIETTGLAWGDHRIIEVYVGLWDLDTRALQDELNIRIDPQRTIQIEAQRVHGISASMLVGCSVWKDVAPQIRRHLDSADLIVGHNWLSFDGPFINYELERVGLKALDKTVTDTMVQGRWATPIGKAPTLGELCFACEVDYDPAKAHAADYDVAVMMECFFRSVDWGFMSLDGETIVQAA